MINEEKWDKLFGIAKRKPEEDSLRPQCDLALAIQQVTEEIVIMMAREAPNDSQTLITLPCRRCSPELCGKRKAVKRKNI